MTDVMTSRMSTRASLQSRAVAHRTASQLALQRRVEGVISLLAPVLDIVLFAGEQVSRVAGRNQIDPDPPRRRLRRPRRRARSRARRTAKARIWPPWPPSPASKSNAQEARQRRARRGRDHGGILTTVSLILAPGRAGECPGRRS